MLGNLRFPEKLQKTKKRIQYFCFNIDQDSERFSCVQCHDIFVKPQQTDCGCRLCFTCLRDHLVSGALSCPGCNTKIISPRKPLHDRAIERELFELSVICLYDGCKHYCKLKNLEEHLKCCGFRDETCTLCLSSYPSKDRGKHASIDCGIFLVRCEDCGQEMTKKVFEGEHKNFRGNADRVCASWKGICPYNCSETLYDSVKVHLTACPSVSVECEMYSAGCQIVVPRQQMIEHMKLYTSEHLTMLMNGLRACLEENARLNALLNEFLITTQFKIENLNNVQKNMTTEVEILEKKLLDAEGKLSNRIINSNLSRSTQNVKGEYVWRIDNVFKKITKAKSEKNPCIHSEPFYTGKPGYRICLKMYPNGNGTGLGNSLSLYFTLIKGDYDAELSWPFRHIITMSLMNSEGKKTMTVNLRPDENIACYGQPNTDSNLPAGMPQYIGHKDLLNLKEFVENESITVYVKVT